jgi:hypothetical protein
LWRAPSEFLDQSHASNFLILVCFCILKFAPAHDPSNLSELQIQHPSDSTRLFAPLEAGDVELKYLRPVISNIRFQIVRSRRLFPILWRLDELMRAAIARCVALESQDAPGGERPDCDRTSKPAGQYYENGRHGL